MAAIDTNVLVRLVTRDDPAQYKKARAFVEANQPVWVTHLSVLELAWVLMSSYGHKKETVLQALKALLEMAELTIQQHGSLEAALETWAGSKADFADCFILDSVRAAAAEPLGTFDATLAKLPGCHRIR